MKKILEADLYEPVKAFFEQLEYEVKGEVKSCDVVAVKGDSLIIIEMKTTLNLDVILQATIRQRLSDIVYIAVPKKNKVLKTARWKNILHLLRRLEIGLLLVTLKNKSSYVEEIVTPKEFNQTYSKRSSNKRRSAVLKEFNERKSDFNRGGVTGTKIITAYKEKAIFIAQLLNTHGDLSIKELKVYGSDPKKTSNILQDNHYGWFTRVSRGVYCLNDTGVKELDGFTHVIECFDKSVKQ